LELSIEEMLPYRYTVQVMKPYK